jgi:hypothetical protein
MPPYESDAAVIAALAMALARVAKAEAELRHAREQLAACVKVSARV